MLRALRLNRVFGVSGELQQDPRSKGVGHSAPRDHDIEDDISRGQPVPDKRRRWLSTEDYPRASAGYPDRRNVSRSSAVLAGIFSLIVLLDMSTFHENKSESSGGWIFFAS
jgi:hypothetical protein